MKTLVSLFAAAWSGTAFASSPTDPGTVPEGLAPSEWSEIRAAHEAARHVPQRQEDGDFVARNPGQQWSTEFDGKGFTVTPNHGLWTWGLVLVGYGDRTLPSAASLHHEGGRITCQRDENLTEWFVNDSRGLEQGWDLQQRPERADPAALLQLHLSTRGNVRPRVSASGDSVSFQEESGGSALSYGSLKAWDADGKKLAVRFEQADGNGIRIAVDDQSARYPITIDPLAQQAFLQASNKAYRDYFGWSVAISGDTAVVGAYSEDSAATGVNGDEASNAAPDSGAAYIFVRSGTGWIQQAYLKASSSESYEFGHTVAISGDTVVVGSRFDSSSGAAYVFARSGTTWSQQAYLKASNAQAQDRFGTSVAISGDTVVVGAPGEDGLTTGLNGDQTSNAASESGAAYVFTRSGTTWTQQAYLKASNTDGIDLFGSTVAVDGDTVVVAAEGEDSIATGVNGNGADNTAESSGAAYVFSRSGNTWAQQAYLKASNTAAFNNFGKSVAVSGDIMVIGAPWESGYSTGVNGDQTNTGSSRSGAAYVFIRSGTAWSQQAYLKSSNQSSNDPYGQEYFGQSVAISGNKVIAGAYQEDSNATGVNGDDSNNSAGESGAAYVFSRSGTTWTQQTYLKANNTQVGAQFGFSVGISGETVLVGAHTMDSNTYGDDMGAAYVTDLFTGPEIYIQQAGTNIASGGAKSFGNLATGGSAELVFDLRNLGVTDLVLSGTPKVAVAGSSDFSVTAQPISPITASGAATTFTVRFAPTSDGLKSATLTLSNNDADEAAYVIKLSGSSDSGTPYQLWENSQDIAGAGPDADSDNDGISNAMEYVIGGDPSGPNSDSRVLLPLITRTSTALTCIFRRTDASFASNPAKVKYGTDLITDWVTAQHGVNGVSIVEENDGFGTGIDKVTVSIPVSGKHKLFARLQVDVP